MGRRSYPAEFQCHVPTGPLRGHSFSDQLREILAPDIIRLFVVEPSNPCPTPGAWQPQTQAPNNVRSSVDCG